MSDPEIRPGWIEVGEGAPGLDAARGALLAMLAAMDPAPTATAVYAVELMLEEYATNARRHGGASRVQLCARDLGSALELEFCDDGLEFDPTSAPPAELPATLDEAQPGGLGITLMAHYAAAWSYERDAGLNRLHISVDKQRP